MNSPDYSTGSPPDKDAATFFGLEGQICDLARMSQITEDLSFDIAIDEPEGLEQVRLLARTLRGMAEQLRTAFYAAHAAGGRA